MTESTGKKIKVKIKKQVKQEDLPTDITDIYREKTIKEYKKPKSVVAKKLSEDKNKQVEETIVAKKTEQNQQIKNIDTPIEKEIDKNLEVNKEFVEDSQNNTKNIKKEENQNLFLKEKEHSKKEFFKQKQSFPKETYKESSTKETDLQDEGSIKGIKDLEENQEKHTDNRKKGGKKFFHHKPSYKEIIPDDDVKAKKHQKEIESEIIFSKKGSILNKKKEPPKQVTQSIPKEITITENIQVSELAKKLNVKPNDVIAKLIKMGEMVTINQILDADTATIVAAEFGADVRVVSLYEETVIKEDEDLPEKRVPRSPVVTIMGHVDHGKTKLLDTIRRSNVAEFEAGAITQHIGAYQVITPKGKITFLDTPGHEAFTAMRARGASITDIVVLVVAADDGVKEQTVEAIRHAQAAKVPIIVAINKIDLPTANPEKVKQELVQYGLQPEDWGGDTIYCEISAKNNIGIDNLLDMILIQAEVLELKANPEVKPVGTVIESKKDPGKGPVATILIQKGTLREGMPFVVGIYSGRVRAMFNDLGQRVEQAEPSTPVEIIGIEGVPEPGDPFHVVESEKEAREIAGKRQYFKQISQSQRKQPTLKDLDAWTKEHKELNIIVKADVHGSVEAIRDGLLKLSSNDVKVNVIYGAAGPITESDVNLALASNAIIVAFNVRANSKALEIAEQNNVEIKYYSIIYNLLEDIEKALKGLLEPQFEEVVTGEAEIRQVYRISKVGNVAGCMVRKGKINRNDRVRLIRDGVVIYDGEVNQLKRFKDDVSEVAEGYECGISISGYNDIKEGDIIEFYKMKEIKIL